MLKVTKYSSEKIMMKDSENPKQKIEVVDGVVTILEGKKIVRTLKSEKLTKKYIEVIEKYVARKEEGKKVNNSKVIETIEEEKEEPRVIEEKKENLKEIEVIEENVIEDKKEEPKLIENNQVISIGSYIEENKKVNNDNTLEIIDFFTKDNNNENFEDFNEKLDKIYITNNYTSTATCVSKPINGIKNTLLTVIITSDDSNFNNFVSQLMLTSIRKEFNYNFVNFDYKGKKVDEGIEKTLSVSVSFPLQKGLTSQLRKDLVKSYYKAKKETTNFIKALIKLKANKKNHDAKKDNNNNHKVV